MRILITGVSGFIGSQLFSRYAHARVAVAGFVRDTGERSALNSQRLVKLEALTREFPNATVMRGPGFGGASEAIADFSPTACVHLAGRTSVRESVNTPGLYADANVASTVELLEILRAARCKRVIHASSVMVYGKDVAPPFREEALGGAPASFYGASKLAAETLFNTWRGLHGFETLNLRLFSVYGPGLRLDSVPHLIASAIRNDRDFTIFGDGSSVRDYIEIDDVLDALDCAVSSHEWTKLPLAINIGSGNGTSLLNLLNCIEQNLGKKARVVFKAANREELSGVVADIKAARRWLNWQPKVTIGDGLRRMLTGLP